MPKPCCPQITDSLPIPVALPNAAAITKNGGGGKGGTGEGGLGTIANAATRSVKKPRRTRPKVLKVSLSAEEKKRLPRGTPLDAWARHILLEAASGRRAVGPSPELLRESNRLMAWQCSLLDQLSKRTLLIEDRADALSQIAALLAQHPEEGGK